MFVMKNKIFLSLFLFAIFILFVLGELKFSKLPSHKVLDIVRADMFYVDMNDNSAIDEGELFKLEDVYAFSDELNDFAKEHAQKLHIDINDYLKTGYLAQNWAKDNLIGKEIEITSLFVDKTKNYNYIKANFEGNDLGEFYLKEGLGFAKENTENQNIKQTKLNADEMSKLNFYLLNLNSNVFHKTDCEFTKLIYRAKLILAKNSKSYIPCKSCIVNSSAVNIQEIQKNEKPEFYKKINNVEIYFTNPLIYKKPDKTCSNDVCKRLVREINDTNSTIDIALYGFGDIEEVYSALKKAKARGVKIRAVVDYSKKMYELYPRTKDFIDEFRAKTDKSETIMHNKFFIFDNKKVLTGSANISPTGLGGYSANTVLLINSEVIAKRYKQEFEQMFEGKFSVLKNKIKTAQDGCISVYFSPKDNIKEVILENINSAKSEIYVSAFFLTQKEVINSLIEAGRRNVKVFIVQDAVGANNFKERVYRLRKEGILVIVENWGGKNHEKTMMIDNKTLIIGSANFSNAGFTKNDENVVLIKDEQIARIYKKYFFYLFNSVDKKYLTRIPRAEGVESINSCTDGIDNNFDGKIDKDDEGCQNY